MSTQLVVRIPEEQKLILEILANNNQVSIAEITRLAIKNYIARMTKDKKGLFIRLVEIGKSKKVVNAPKDLSENYKKYLYYK